MKDILAKILEPLCIEELPHSLFTSFDQSLRFELGGEEFGADRPMRRFAQAFLRSNAISQALFERSSEVYVALSSYGDEKPPSKRLIPLKHCGLKKHEFKYLGKTPQEDDGHYLEDGSNIFRHWDMAKLNDKGTISDILWLGIAAELGIKPTFYGSTKAYLIDPEYGLVLHLYDDRGMDVVATHNASLVDLFLRFNDWLLDYNRARMTSMFGSGE